MINKLKTRMASIETDLKEMAKRIARLDCTPLSDEEFDKRLQDVYDTHDNIEKAFDVVKQYLDFTPDLKGIVKASKLADALVNWAEYTEKRI